MIRFVCRYKGQLLFAGTRTEGVFVSSNSGANWSTVNAGLPAPVSISSLETDGTQLYAGTSWDNGTNLYHGMFISPDTRSIMGAGYQWIA